MTDRYIIYRKIPWTGNATVDGSFSFFCKFIGPDNTICWSFKLEDATTFDSYDNAHQHICELARRHGVKYGIDLHPESRYE